MEDYAPTIELEHDVWELSDKDIDEILGKENTDTEGLSTSFLDGEAIDDAIDAFMDEHGGQIPDDKKGIWKNLFKKGIKKKIKPDDTDEESFSEFLYHNQITPQEFNTTISGVLPDATLSIAQETTVNEQIARIEFTDLDYAYQSLQTEAKTLQSILPDAPEEIKPVIEDTLSAVTERMTILDPQLNASADVLQSEYKATAGELYQIHENNGTEIEQVLAEMPKPEPISEPIQPVQEPTATTTETVDIPVRENIAVSTPEPVQPTIAPELATEPPIEPVTSEITPLNTIREVEYTLNQVLNLHRNMIDEAPVVSSAMESNNFIHTGILTTDHLMHSEDRLTVAEMSDNAVSLTMKDGEYLLNNVPLENYGFPTEGSKFHAIQKTAESFSSLLSPEVNNTRMYEEHESHNNFDPEADTSQIQGPAYSDSDDFRYREAGYNPEVANGATVPMPGSSGTGFNKELETFRQSSIDDERELMSLRNELNDIEKTYEQPQASDGSEILSSKLPSEVEKRLDEIKEQIEEIQTRQEERENLCNEQIKSATEELKALQTEAKGIDMNSDEGKALYQRMEACQENITLAKECKRINDEVRKEDGFVHQKLIGEVNNFANERNNAPQTKTEQTDSGKKDETLVNKAREIDIKNFKRFYALEPVEKFLQSVTKAEAGFVPVNKIDGTAMQGVREIKGSFLYQSAAMFLSGMGFSSQNKIAKDLDKRIGETFDFYKKNGLDFDASTKDVLKKMNELSKKGELSALDGTNIVKLGLKKNAKGKTVTTLNEAKYAKILKERNDMSQYLLKNTPGLSKEEINFLNSREFFTNTNSKMMLDILKKDIKKNGSVAANKIKWDKLSAADMKRLAKHPEKYGLTGEQARVAKKAAETKLKERMTDKSHSIRGITRLGAQRFTRMLESMDEGMSKLVGVVNKSIRRVKTAHKLLTVSTGLIKKYMPNSFVARKLNKFDRFKQRVKDIAKKPANYVKTRTKAVAKKAGSAAANKAKAFARNTAKKWNHSAVGKGVTKVSNSVKNSAGGKFVSKASRKVAKAAKKTKKALGATSKLLDRIISAPIKLIGKFISGLRMVIGKVIAALGGAIIMFIKALLIYYAVGFLLLAFMDVISLDFLLVSKKMDQSSRSIVEQYIGCYDSYGEMEDDIDMLKEMDEKTKKKAIEFGESEPPSPYNVGYANHPIKQWGSPDKEKGYNLHYYDVHGQEMESTTTNAKDIMALCVAMCDNHVVQRAGKAPETWQLFIPGWWAIEKLRNNISKAKYMSQFEDLLEDMHALMVYEDPETGEPFSWEATDLYYCDYGCEEFNDGNGYYCDDYSYYQKRIDEINQKVKYYADFKQKYTGTGCSTYIWQEWEEDWREDYVGWHYEYDYDYDWYGNEYQTRRIVDDYEWHDHGKYVDHVEHYCPGHWDYIPVCYGHRDVDINIVLYDARYAIENNIFPEDWESKSYADLIRNFVEQGGWNSKWHRDCALNYREGDWVKLYGFDVEEGAGFTTQETFRPADIKKMMEELTETMSDEQITESRQQILEYALDAVGRIGYQWGGKADGTGWNAKFGSSEADGKGRKNGLDCSGFVQWVYGSTLGVNLPGSTAGYSGSTMKKVSKDELKVGDLGFYKSPGAEDNHIGIYAGKNKYGQDMWVHCAGSTGVTYSTGGFKDFYDPLAR